MLIINCEDERGALNLRSSLAGNYNVMFLSGSTIIIKISHPGFTVKAHVKKQHQIQDFFQLLPFWPVISRLACST